jgi:small subunit ribosomal protein S4
MSRYIGPTWKISRRLNYSLSETGKELVRKKESFSSSKQKKRKNKLSDYGIQLQEKQKVRFTYGVSEKQFKKIFHNASKSKGVHGEVFLTLLESRLDNMVYRMGFAKTRSQARQLISHGHVLVDTKKVDIGSYRLKPGQQVSLKEKTKELDIVKKALEFNKNNRIEYISVNKELVGTYIRYPQRNEFLHEINEQLIVEFYNR